MDGPNFGKTPVSATGLFFQGLIFYFHRRVNGDLYLKEITEDDGQKFRSGEWSKPAFPKILFSKYVLNSEIPGRRTKGVEVYSPISSRQGLLLKFLGT
jgi:hypothetical protein